MKAKNAFLFSAISLLLCGQQTFANPLSNGKTFHVECVGPQRWAVSLDIKELGFDEWNRDGLCRWSC